MNGLQKIALRNIKGIFDWEVGGWYNCLQDGCEELIPDTVSEAKELIYDESLEDAASDGWYRSGAAPVEMRFAGSKFIKESIDALFREDSDVAEIASVKGWRI